MFKIPLTAVIVFPSTFLVLYSSAIGQSYMNLFYAIQKQQQLPPASLNVHNSPPFYPYFLSLQAVYPHLLNCLGFLL